MASTPDGPRYVASLQSTNDPCCYKDFFEGEKFEEAKQEADEAFDRNNRNTIVYDRKLMEITYRKQALKLEPEKIDKKSKRGKKVVKKEKSSKDAYFE